MSTVALSRPGTVATLIAAGGAVGVDGNATFKLHVQQYSDQYEVRVTEVTGDGHTAPEFQHGGLLYGQFRLSGYMVAGDFVGIASLIADKNGGYGTGNGAVAAHTMEVRFDANKKVSGNVIITSIQRQMAKNSPHIQIAMSGYWMSTQTVNSVQVANPVEASV